MPSTAVAAAPLPSVDVDSAAPLPNDGLCPLGAPDQAETPYLTELHLYASRNPIRLHTPGHKGNASGTGGLVDAVGERALGIDVPLPTLNASEPPSIRRAEALAARAWGAKRTWFLANGASQGNHAACLALAHSGQRVVVQRNAHVSTINGLVLSGLAPTFLTPGVDPALGVAHCPTPDALDRALIATPDAAGALVVSPTYYGAAADVRGLARVAHRHGVALIVDEAWGSHFPFHDALPESALAAGADLVISSTHKIIGSLTQSAMLHLGTGAEARLDEEAVGRALDLVGSTSPSSLLLGSLDAARRRAALHGRELIDSALEAAEAVRAAICAMPGMRPLDDGLVGRFGVHGYDPLQLAIDVSGLGVSGYDLARTLRRSTDINLELVEDRVVVALFGMADVAEYVPRLVDALASAAEVVAGERAPWRGRSIAAPAWGPPVIAPRTAFLARDEVVMAEEAIGRIAAESIVAYPPGIPNVLPGERLTAETLAYVRDVLHRGGRVRGPADSALRTVRVVNDPRIGRRASDRATALPV
ncbi:MAG: DegT/DnrJ/EryC1/StrS family aminotransferase [Actinomycetota bacterium]|nr:DegT/DnrJ/EryC1/StrS family aminotransferase [Actinomycetota bacterium]